MAAARGRQVGGGGTGSLKAIAAESGMSIASVSRILRGRDQCSADTRARVLAVAEKHRYRPNMLVQGMRTGQTRTIGCLIHVQDEFFGRLAAGIHDALVAADYVPIFLWPRIRANPTEPTNELEQIHRLLDRRVDGVILRPNDDGINDNYLHELWDRGVPLVAVDRELEKTHADFVGTDDEQGGRLAGEYLRGLGHRCVGHLAGPDAITTSRLRRRGFEAAVHGLQLVTECDITFGGPATLDAARRLLAHRPRPTAVFCANDYQAAFVYGTAADLGLRIPQDLAVVGFADLQLARYLQPELTTVRQCPERIGGEAVRLLLARMAGTAPATPQKLRLPTELVTRASTAPPR